MIATPKSEQGAQASADLFLTPSPAARSDFEEQCVSDCLCFLTICSRKILGSWGAAPRLQRQFQDSRSQFRAYLYALFSLLFPFTPIFSLRQHHICLLSLHNHMWLLSFCQRKLVHHSPAMRQWCNTRDCHFLKSFSPFQWVVTGG